MNGIIQPQLQELEIKKEDEENVENIVPDNVGDDGNEQQKESINKNTINPMLNFEINTLTCWEWLRRVNINSNNKNNDII